MSPTDARLGDLVLRRAQPGDEPAVLDLLQRSMGWPAEGHDKALFEWKHRANPFGASPAWVADDQGRLAGYRTFMRWDFIGPDDRVVRALRAVDTVTAPEYRGRGVFRALTLLAVAEMTTEGASLVFNTPNDASRPGYLSMGWTKARRLPVAFWPSGLAGLSRMRRARVPADLWSLPTDVGEDAASAMANESVVRGLLRHAPVRGFRTHRTPEYLRWRTGFAPLRYRIMRVESSEPERGGVVFRLRARGEARELVVVESFVSTRRDQAALLRRLLRQTGADYALELRPPTPGLMLPLPGQGPLLITRGLAGAPPSPRDWLLTLGDIELF